MTDMRWRITIKDDRYEMKNNNKRDGYEMKNNNKSTVSLLYTCIYFPH
jgi:uncharacterized surface anchored protein